MLSIILFLFFWILIFVVIKKGGADGIDRIENPLSIGHIVLNGCWLPQGNFVMVEASRVVRRLDMQFKMERHSRSISSCLMM